MVYETGAHNLERATSMHTCNSVLMDQRIINRGYYMAARGYEVYLRVLKVTLTSERSEQVRDPFSTRR